MTKSHREQTFEAEVCLALQGIGLDDPRLGTLVKSIVEKRQPALDDDQALAQGVWLHAPGDTGYDYARALYPPDLFAYLEATQPQELAKIIKPDMSEADKAAARERILSDLANALDRKLDHGRISGGALNILRHGFPSAPAVFKRLLPTRPQMPPSAHTQKTWDEYNAVRVRVMQQVHYSNQIKADGLRSMKSIDLVFFVNGIPVTTVELKTETTQSVEDAIIQYKKDRPITDEPLLNRQRAIVHFAVSNDAAWMTTHLQGKDTRFLPFNKGTSDGSLLPEGIENLTPPDGDSAASYLWRDIWTRDSFLDILSQYAFVQHKTSIDAAGKEKVQRTIIFPRYHQLDVVRKTARDVRVNGVGGKYLAQHSAGSGKTNEIAWLSHRLARTIDQTTGEAVFDKVIVVTDRDVLDKQLQEAIKQLEHNNGYVLTVDGDALRDHKATGKSTLLTQQLSSNAGARIIVVTMQSFLPTLQKLEELEKKQGIKQGQRHFAVIADEAHQSQTGSTARALRKALNPDERSRLQELLDEQSKAGNNAASAQSSDNQSAQPADQGDEKDEPEVSADELIASLDTKRAGSSLSFFAFTATPKAKTLQLFGHKNEDDEYVPFHVYSMQQAIDEGFILDVLMNYTTYNTALKVVNAAAHVAPVVSGSQAAGALGSGEPDIDGNRDGGTADLPSPENEDRKVDRQKATMQVLGWAYIHRDTIKGRAEIIIEHFIENGMRKLGGKGKAMVVTSKRLAAVRYKLALDHYIKQQGYDGDIETVVAFSGEVEDDNTGETYTEQSMNASKADVRKLAKRDKVRIIIVADKLQTGYDEPNLIGMYVDKKLKGVKTVQTLSRLNRTRAGKDQVYVLDFVNDPDAILEDFKTYQHKAKLQKETDPNGVFLLQTAIDDLALYSEAELANVIKVINTAPSNARLNGVLHPIKVRVAEERLRAQKLQDDRRMREAESFIPLMRQFCSLYQFMSQVVAYDNAGLENSYKAYELLVKYLSTSSGDVTVVDTSILAVDAIRHTNTGTRKLDMGSGAGSGEIIGGHVASPRIQTRTEVLLSEVIRRINEFFGNKITDAETDAWVKALLSQLHQDEPLKNQKRSNKLDQFLGSSKLKNAVIKAVLVYGEKQNELSSLIDDKTGEFDKIVKMIGELFYGDSDEIPPGP